MSRVLVVAAHPDDEVLGVGGTVLRHRAAGDEVRIIVHYACRGVPPPEGDWWGVTNGEPVWQADLDALVRDYAPEVVYTHFAGDINADHRRVSEAVRVACRPYAAPSVKRLLEFYTVSSTEWGDAFHPTVFVDISEHIAGKMAALAPYLDELREWPHPRSVNGIADAARFFGSQAGYEHAEPFVLVRERW